MGSLPIPDVAPNERLNRLVANLRMHSTEPFGRPVAHRLEIGRSVVRSGQVEGLLKPAKLREKIEGDRLTEPLDQPSLIRLVIAITPLPVHTTSASLKSLGSELTPHAYRRPQTLRQYDPSLYVKGFRELSRARRGWPVDGGRCAS
jgi:hypothetical protein